VQEKEAKAMLQAEMELKKGQNMIEHKEEIYSRPARTWFQSEKEKAAAKVAGKAPTPRSAEGAESEKKFIKRDKYAGLSRKQTRRKLARELDEKDPAAVRSNAAAIREAKRVQRPRKIGEVQPRNPLDQKATGKKKSGLKLKKISLGGKGKSAFGDSHEGMRAKRVKVDLMKKGKSKGKGKEKGGKVPRKR